MSSKSIYRPATDGLPARVSGDWAQTKLESLSNYLQIVNVAMQRKFAKRCYVDLMAGGGRCVLKRSGLEFDGSPLLALACKPAFTSLVFVESDSRLFDALTARTSGDRSRTHLILGDCNEARVIEQIRSATPQTALSIAFIDMSLIRFRGHFPKGGYDVQNGITQSGTESAAAVHGRVHGRRGPARVG